MTAASAQQQPRPTAKEPVLVPEHLLGQRIAKALAEAGADRPSVDGATRALLHAARLGIDSHGARLVPHYVRMMKGGRINPRPQRRILRRSAAAALVDADDGLGHAAAYEAVALAGELARASGAGAVGVMRSSHFGATAAYTIAGAEAGLITLVTCNTDTAVALHGSARAFHGTNPIGIAAPVVGAKPWLLEIATSAAAFNRIVLYRTLGKPLPEGIAADADGAPTCDPASARMLLPLGGAEAGHKGAALAGLCTILSAALTGATLDHEMISMWFTDDVATPRNLGHFVIALDPDHFIGRSAYAAAMARYLAGLRATPARPGARVLAPGDREWEIEAERAEKGLPVDRDTATFLGLTDE